MLHDQRTVTENIDEFTQVVETHLLQVLAFFVRSGRAKGGQTKKIEKFIEIQKKLKFPWIKIPSLNFHEPKFQDLNFHEWKKFKLP